MIDARTLMTESIERLIAFLEADRDLFHAVLLAVPEAASDASGPLDQHERISPIIRAARSGWCGVFSDWLTPVMEAAYHPLLVLTPGELRQDADQLSDLIVRTTVHRANGMTVRADALWGYWFYQCIVGRTGPAAEQRERAERDVREGQVAHSIESPVARLARSMFGCRDMSATIATYVTAAEQAATAGNWAEHSDSLSRAGLAALWFGDWDRAGALLSESEFAARQHLGEDDPRIARALSNLAELSARSGRPDRALREVKEALRLRGQDTGPMRDRRMRLTEGVRVIAYLEHGYVTRAERLAARLREESRGTDNQAKDLLTHAKALRLTGRPGAALRLLHDADQRSFGAFGLEKLTELAACEFDLVRPDRAAAHLAPLAVNWSWYAHKISARLTFDMLIRYALAKNSHRTLVSYREEALGWKGIEQEDQLFERFGRASAQLLRHGGNLEAAHEELRAVSDSEARRVADGRLFRWHPSIAATRLEQAECHEARNSNAEAERDYRWVVGNPALDPTHPIRVAAILGLARLAHRAGLDKEAVDLLHDLPASYAWPLDPELEISEEMTRLRRILGIDTW
ncbi:hypothetical protein ACIBG8_41570 [Nonomuraea sp. NPDC050556]|uniref:hypothetical protein n=1 Tax=Nonomuraea sp. NPDC050556 TaxID=3364369 RepID=UPI0037B168E3